MPPDVRIETLSTFSDARGTVFEPLAAEALAAQRNVHVVLTEPGHVRGNHRHLRGDEQLVVLGPALVRTRVDDVDTDVIVEAGTLMRFTIPVGVAHAVKNTGDRTMLLVSFATRPFDEKDPDVERVPIL